MGPMAIPQCNTWRPPFRQCPRAPAHSQGLTVLFGALVTSSFLLLVAMLLLLVIGDTLVTSSDAQYSDQ